MATPQNPRGRPVKAVVLIAMALFAGIVVIALISSGDNGATGQATAPAEAQNTEAEPQAVASAPSFPPLHFVTSGRLPTEFHGTHLGSSVEEVIAQDPGFQECVRGAASPSNPNESLCQETPDGYSVILSFMQGRLIDIIANVSAISPGDAALFERSTLTQLGQPAVDVYDGSSERNLVWIDGDLRIRYTSIHGTDGSRTVTMEMAVYPEMMEAMEEGKGRLWTSDLWIKQLKRDWGETSAGPERAPLPRGFSDVQLRMTPWQVRTALPGIAISTFSDREATGKLQNDSGETSMDFWDGQVESIFRSWHIQPDQITKMQHQLIEKFGSPLSCDPNALQLTWDDGSTDMTYQLNKGGQAAGEVDVWFSDDELSSLQEAANLAANRPEFKTAPAIHSFF